MTDQRFRQLADLLVKHSTRVVPGDRVLIEATHIPTAMLAALTKAVAEAGGIPIVDSQLPAVKRQMLMTGTLAELEKRLQFVGELELERMKRMQCYIGMRGAENICELSDVSPERMALYERYVQQPVQIEQRVKHTRWVVLRWPNPSMAQQAEMSTEAFEDYYFSVCLTDYQAMGEAVKPLVKRMQEADRVRIVAPGTDLRFSVKGIPAVPCYGLRNIPDGECYTAPVRESVNGTVTFNTPTVMRGVKMDNIFFRFENGRIVESNSTAPEALEKILNSDEGARYIGEFAIGFNPNVTKPMCDTLFDEKINGSLHLAMGCCYDAAFNGNKSSIHWDLVLRQNEGGEIYFDDELIRKDGIFVTEDLAGLNPEALNRQ